MDPNAAYDLWKDALRRGNKIAAIAHAMDLCGWIVGGGFPPHALDTHQRGKAEATEAHYRRRVFTDWITGEMLDVIEENLP